MMMVKPAKAEDYGQILTIDESVEPQEWKRWADNGQVFFIYEEGAFAGWLQFSLLLESVPCINRFYIAEQYRGLGDGTLTLLIWQRKMQELGYDRVMFSCEEGNADAQKFIEKNAYQKAGALQLPDKENTIFYYRDLEKAI